MKKYLFICTGNTCRSPIAESLFRAERPDASVASAGVAACDGASISENAIQVLGEWGLPAPPAPRPLTGEMLAEADEILCMTAEHKRRVQMKWPEISDKVRTLGEWAGLAGTDVSDPFGGDISLYRAVRDELMRLIRQGLDREREDK